MRVADLEVMLVLPERKPTCVPQMTTLRAVLGSPARVRHARASKLQHMLKSYKRAAGMYADIATLEAAHALGMQYTDAVMKGLPPATLSQSLSSCAQEAVPGVR
jgi:hypothetical protein